MARRGALLFSFRHSKKSKRKHRHETPSPGKPGGRDLLSCLNGLLYGVRIVFLRVVVQVISRENVVPARHLGNDGPRRDLVQPEVAVHLKEITTGDATAGEAVLSKTR